MSYNLAKTEQQYDNFTYDGSSIGEYKKPKRRLYYFIAAVVVVVVLVLALGLGIGLGTRSTSSSSGKQEPIKAKDQTSSATQTTQHTKTSSTHVQASTTSGSPTTTRYVDWLAEPCVDQDSPPLCPWNSSENPLLLVSLDGFKAEYVLRNLTPVIQKLRSCGVHTPYMRAAYPTLTFPNHYTIVTGLYPESNGIVGNKMYDPILNESFSLSSSNKYHPYWWKGEPLWITAKKQGKKAASYFWVGSDVNISGVHPDIWYRYNGKIPFEERVDTVIGWLLKDRRERPDFITLYFNEPDHQGHGTGPDSPEVDKMLGKVDNIIKRLMNGLFREHLDHCVNVIILADHGMAPTSCERQVDLHTYLDLSKMLLFKGTTGHISPNFYKDGSVVVRNENPMATSDVIKHLECKNSHLNVFTRDTIPKRHHYTNSERIGDVMMDVESSWLVYDKKSSSCLAGNHGYDNIYKSMHALFLAHGPDFQQSLEVKPFENIELYNLMSELLHITPAPNNGTIGALHHFLRTPDSLSRLPNETSYPVCQINGTSTSSSCSCQNLTHDSSLLGTVQSAYPLGVPVLEVKSSVCALPGIQFTLLYSHKYKMPMLASYTLNPSKVSRYQPENKTCVVVDPRLTDDSNPDCLEYANLDQDIIMSRLYDTGFAINDTEKTEASLSSNIVPLYRGFKTGIWSYLWRAIREYVSIYGDVSITTGPIFDYNADGLRDYSVNNTRFVSNTSTVPLPTHYFMILVKCKNNSTSLQSCSAEELDILSFILPHQPKKHNCIPDKDFLENNVARIKDIEELTGLRFMTRFDRATGARLRTFLPTALWAAPVVTAWADLPCTTTTDHCPQGRPPVLLISLDGFRADYLKRHLTPTIARLSQCGVHTPYMRSVYPTVTFPNHYTIVTGLYPESHGIVYNTMVDEDIAHLFSISKPIAKDPRWWKGEPIWITAKKQGLKTATYFWPGSDVNISDSCPLPILSFCRVGIYPDIWKHYDGAAGYTERVYEVLGWLDMPQETRPDFMTLYFDQPDHEAHIYGPDSAAVNGQLQTVDELIDILMTNLYERNMQNCIDIIIIADHGFDGTSCSKTVTVSDYYQNITEMYMIERVFGQVFPQFVKKSSTVAEANSKEFSVQDIIETLNCKHPAMNVFTKDNLPKRHHFTNNDRIAPVLLDMETEWMVFDDRTYYCKGGNHGWDNTYKSMHALFLAHGPSFKQNYTADPFENLELYNLMSELLNIEPAPNNGTVGSLSHILKNPKNATGAYQINTEICNSSKQDLVPMCGCTSINVADLNLSSVNATTTVNKVLVLGEPQNTQNDSTCIVTDDSSAWAFSKTFHSPIWLSTLASNSTMTDYTSEPCIVSDPRTEGMDINCTQYLNGNLATQSLMINGISSFDGILLSSTLVPMYEGFQKGIWNFVNELVREYISVHDTISITTGAIYDYNNNGLWEGIVNETRFASEDQEIPIPSDIYVILAKCKDKTAQLPCNGDVDLLSFILPHLQEIPNCLSYKDYLRDNVARIRDIELLTGLQFMTFKSDMSTRLRTFLPIDLWDSTMFRTWSDIPCSEQDQCPSDYRPVLLLSLSGFRADYLMRNFTPNLKRLSECGTRAPYMRAVYPTKTYPNHYTIVTGLYPESHGIVDDIFYDVDIGDRFDSGDAKSMKDPRWWNGAEPIWVRAKKQGLKTAAYSWPGSYANISGKSAWSKCSYPDIWKELDQSESYTKRVNEILSWLSLPEGERPSFIAVHFEEPGKTGHSIGPSNTDGIGAVLKQVDDALGRLMEGLYEKDLHNCVNLVIVSDHGMADVSCRRLVRLKYYVNEDYLKTNFYVWDGGNGRVSNTYIYNSAVKGIVPNTNPIPLDDIKTNITCKSTHLRPYFKTQLPVRFHYSNNERIDSLILEVDPEWLVTRSYINICRGGNSGYDNMDSRMQSLFLAHGPAFKKNFTTEPFQNIELYNMFTAILNMTSAPNNGTLGSLYHILSQPPGIPKTDSFANYTTTDMAAIVIPSHNQTDCSSDCPQLTTAQISEFLEGLSASEGNEHVPWGLPALTSNRFINSIIKALHQPTHLTGYDTRLMLPLWVSQTLNYSEVLDDRNSSSCVINDPRQMGVNDICSSKPDKQKMSLLYKGFGSDEKAGLFYRLTSTLVPMMQGFQSAIWNPLQNLISQWVHKYRQVNLITGPVFDYNGDGIADSYDGLTRGLNSTKQPSHFFTTVTRCKDQTLDLDKCTDLLTTAFIIPHIMNITNCMRVQDFIAINEARVRDVEIITGLRFFTTLSVEDRVKLQISLPDGTWRVT